MLRRGTLWCALAALVLATAIAASGAAGEGTSKATKPAAAPKPAPKPATAADKKPDTPMKHSALPGEYAPMARECQLTPDQIDQVYTRIQAKKNALAEHEKQKAGKIHALRNDLRAARLKNDQAAIKKAEDAIKAAEDEGAKLETAQENQVLSPLKPEQRITWEGFLLHQKASVELRGAGLSADMMAEVREICNAFAKEVIPAADLFKARKDTVTRVVKAVLKQGPMPAGYSPKKAGADEKAEPAAK